jgi:hypothetical protein
MGGQFGVGALAGPIVSDGEQLAQVVQQAVFGGDINPDTGRSRIPAELVALGKHNIPLINLWYTRTALDYLFLWRLQEAASPGYLARYEDRVKNQEHGDFIVSPTSALQ